MPMELPTFLLGLFLLYKVGTIIYNRLKKDIHLDDLPEPLPRYTAQPRTQPNSSGMHIPKPIRPDLLYEDLILINDASEDSVNDAIRAFFDTCQGFEEQANIKLSQISERCFAISFQPVDMVIFGFAIQEFVWRDIEVKAWKEVVNENGEVKKAMLTAVLNDTEDVIIYVTTSDNAGYEVDYALKNDLKPIDAPYAQYAEPEFTYADLVRYPYQTLSVF